MILNTSFNLKNQPIVETPEDAVKSLMACEGRVAALFIGPFEVTPRPFPFSDLDALSAASGLKLQGVSESKEGGEGEGVEEGLSALLEAELSVVVRAKRFYMMEMVSSSGVASSSSGSGSKASTEPLRIRIQGTLFLVSFNFFSFLFLKGSSCVWTAAHAFVGIYTHSSSHLFYLTNHISIS